MRRSLVALSCLVGLATAGCQGHLAQKELKTERKICDQIAAVGQALDQVSQLQPSSTVGEAKAADQALATALAGLKTSDQTLEKLRLEAFQKQLNAFKGEVSKVTSNKSLTLAQAAADLKAKAQPVIQARRALSASVKCEEAPAAPAKP